MGLFLIRSPNCNVIKGWIQCIELQTFVTNRKVEERKALVQLNSRLCHTRRPGLARAECSRSCISAKMRCTICTSAAAGDAATAGEVVRASGSRAAPTRAGDGGEDEGSR